MTTTRDPGDLSRLLVDLARVPRLPLPEAVVDALPAGTVVGRFVIEREIGRGGFGIVYAAKDPELGRLVAIKILHPGIGLARGETDWIRREAEAVARLAHPAIVTLFDAGRSEAGAYLVFELLQGESLAERMAKGPLKPEEALRIATAVASALEHAHAAGILHRDLKPANVFLCTSGAVKVLDFGIAQLFDREGPPSSGTRGYMAPEQQEGRGEDARTDLFALGMVIRAMLGEGASDAKPPRRAGGLARLAWDLTRPEPKDRPASARAVLDRLEAVARGRSTSPRWWVAATVAGLLLVAGGIWESARKKEAPPGERIVVALAPTRNETGAPELDPLSEMLRTGLSDSPRVRVVARARMAAALAQMGKDAGTKDEGPWREAARRTGATAVILPEAEKSGADLVVTLTVKDVESGRTLHRSKASAATLEALPLSLDRALRDLRIGIGERAEDLAKNGRSLTELTTANLAAYREYARGMECDGKDREWRSAESLTECSPYFLKALDADPSFALARLQLSRLGTANVRGTNADRETLNAVESASSRLTRRDAALARAWRDHATGNDRAALERYAALISENPGDVEAIYAAGDLLFHAGRYSESASYMTRLLELGEAFPFAFQHAVEALAMADREEELAKLLDGTSSPRASDLVMLSRGYLWLGRYDRAIEVAKSSLETLPARQGNQILMDALVVAGRYDEAEALLAALRMEGPEDFPTFLRRYRLSVLRGRSTTTSRMLAADPGFPDLSSATPDSRRTMAMLKAATAAGDRDLPRVRAEFRKEAILSNGDAGVTAVQLAFLGTRKDIAEVRRLVAPGSTAAREVEALDAWRSGDAALAVSRLAGIETDAPHPTDALSPAYLLAEVAREDDPSEALAAAARFRKRILVGPARWTCGRSLLVSAEAAWRLGRPDEAMGFIAQAEKLLAVADPGYPTAVEMTRLRKAIESGEPPKAGVHFGPR